MLSAINSVLIDEDRVSQHVEYNLASLAAPAPRVLLDASAKDVQNFVMSSGDQLSIQFESGGLQPSRKNSTLLTRTPYCLVACVKNELQHVFDSDTETFTDVKKNKRKLTVAAAIDIGLINPTTSAVMHWNFRKLFFLPDALKFGLINQDGEVFDHRLDRYISLKLAVYNKTLVCMEKPYGLEQAMAAQLYDSEIKMFKDPENDLHVSFMSAFAKPKGFLDINTSFVINHRGKFLNIKDAFISKDLSDTGDLYNGNEQWLSLEEAFERNKLRTLALPLNLADIIRLNLIDPDTGMVKIDDENLQPLRQAINMGFVSHSSPTKTPTKTETISLRFAIQTGLVNPDIGFYNNTETGAYYELETAHRMGLIPSQNCVPSVVEIVTSNSFNPEWSRLVIGKTYHKTMTIKDALESGIIHSNGCFVKERGTNDVFPFTRAHERGLMDLQNAVYYADADGTTISLSESVKQGFIFELKIPVRLAELISQELVLETKGLILHPVTGQYTSLAELISSGALDVCSLQVEDTRKLNGVPLSIDEAADAHILDLNTGFLTDYLNFEEYDLVEAWNLGLIQESEAPITVYQAVRHGRFATDKGALFTPDRKEKSIHEAGRCRILHSELPSLKIKNKIYSFGSALRFGLIDRTTGTVNLALGLKVSFHDALERNVILQPDSVFTLFEALKYGLWSADEKFSAIKFIHPALTRRLTLEQAFATGFIVKTGTAIVLRNQYWSIDRALAKNILNPQLGLIQSGEETMSLPEAIQSKKMIPSQKPLTLEEIFEYNLFDNETQKFIDPEAGDQLTLEEALKFRLLHPENTFYWGNSSGQIKPVQIAIDEDFISTKRCMVMNQETEEWVGYESAFKTGLLFSAERNLTFTEAYERNLINVRRCTYTDPRFEETMPLEKAIKGGWLNCEEVHVKDTQTDSYMPIKSAIRMGHVDIERRVTIDSVSGQWFPMILRFPGGVIAFSRQSYTFEELFENSYLNFKTAVVTDPSSQRNYTVLKAIQMDVLDPTSALVKDTEKKQLLTLDKACDREVLSPSGEILNTLTGEKLSIIGALATGLILIPNKPFSLTDALDYGTYVAETGLFQSPWTASGDISFGEAITLGLLDYRGSMVRDADSEVSYSLEEATDRGLIDSVTGQVFDSTTGKRMSLLEAFQRNLIIDVYAQESVQQSFSACESDIDQLLRTLMEVERRLGEQMQDVDKTINNINDKILQLQEVDNGLAEVEPEVTRCIVMTDQLSTDGADMLSPEEFHSLRRHRDQLRDNFQNSRFRLSAMLDRLRSASKVKEEFDAEVENFKKWMGTTEADIDQYQTKCGDPEQLTQCQSAVQRISEDIEAHEPNLHLIQTLGSQLQDEIRGYQEEAAYLKSPEQPLPPRAVEDADVRSTVREVRERYESLGKQCLHLYNTLVTIGASDQDFVQKLSGAHDWLNKMDTKISERASGVPGADPTELSRQLTGTKDLTAELVDGHSLVEDAKSAGDNYLGTIKESRNFHQQELRVTGDLETLNESTTMESCTTITVLHGTRDDSFNNAREKLGEETNTLQTLLTQSQGVAGGLEEMEEWLQHAESLLSLPRPLPLNTDKITLQKNEQQVFDADVSSHGAALEGLGRSIKELMLSSPSPATAKLEPKLEGLFKRHDMVRRKCRAWKDNLDHTQMNLDVFLENRSGLEEWLDFSLQTLDSDSVSEPQIQSLLAQIPEKNSDLNLLKQEAQNLYALPNATETVPIKEAIQQLDNKLERLKSHVRSKQEELAVRNEQIAAYQGHSNSVFDWLADKETALGNIGQPGLDSVDVQAQIGKVKAIKDDHGSFKPELDKLAAFASELNSNQPSTSSATDSAGRKDGPPSPASTTTSSGFGSYLPGSSVADETNPQGEVTHLTQRYDILGSRLQGKSEELDAQWDKLDNYEQRRKKLADWIDGQRSWAQSVPLPTNRDESLQRLQDVKELNEQIKAKRPEFETVKAEAQDLMRLQHAELTPGFATLAQRQKDLQEGWDELQEECRALQHKMHDAKDFHTACNQLQGWLDGKEKMIRVLGPIPHDSNTIATQLQQINVLQDEFETQKPNVDHLNETAEGLKKDAEEEERSEMEDKLRDVNEKYRHLQELLAERQKDLVASQDVGSQIAAKQQAIQQWLDPFALKLEKVNQLGSQPHQSLNDIDELQNELDSRAGDLDELALICAQLDEMNADPAVRADVRKRLEAARANYDQMHTKLVELKADAERKKAEDEASETYRALEVEAKPLFEEVQQIESRFQGLGPIGRDLETLRSQKDETQSLITQVKAKSQELAQRRDSLTWQSGSGAGSVSEGASTSVSPAHSVKKLEDEYRSYEANLDGIKEKGEVRCQDIDQIQSQVSELLGEIDQTDRKICDYLGSEVLSQRVKGNLPEVKGQIEALEQFKRGEVQPVSRESDEILGKAEGLVKSADPGVDTSFLTSESKRLGRQKKDLEDKTSQKEQQLDKALLGLGNFRDAANSLSGWLEDTEELVANQKPPSPDHKVVKAQLQEQKLVQRLLDEKHTMVNALNNMADQLESVTTDENEKEQIKEETEEINQRYENLCASAEQRQDILMEAGEIAKEWADKLQPILSWLDHAEKALEKLGNVPTDEEKLQKHMQDHQELNNEISEQRPEFDGLLDLGQRLSLLVSPDDAELLHSQSSDIAQRYDDLGRRSDAVGHVLQETADGIGKLLSTAELLAEWIDNMEQRLHNAPPLSVFPEVLQEQCDEHMALTEEILEQQANVVQLVEDGRELCKHTTGDEAISLQGRLDGLKLRFSALSSKADSKVNDLQQGLHWSEIFHDDHEKLDTWLGAAESDLAQIDDAAIDQQNEIIQNMAEDVIAFRPMLETANVAGSRVSQISGGDGPKTVEEMTSKLNRRFDTVCEQVQRKGERLSITMARSFEVLGDMDELIDWLREAETRLQGAGGASANPELAKKDLDNQRLMNQDIMSQKSRGRDLISKGKKLIKDCTAGGEDGQAIQDKIEVLKDLSETVASFSGERFAMLEQAYPLAESFGESLAELNEWLSTIETELETAPDVIPGHNAEQLRKQQDHNMSLQQSIQEQKPFMAKLEKTGNSLSPMCREEDAQWVRDALDGMVGRYESLKDNVKIRGSGLSEALQESSQFSDKLDGMLATLNAAAEQIRNPEPVSAHPERIRTQISDNCALMDELGQRTTAYEAVKDAADDLISKADPNDPAVFEIQEKMSSLEDLWEEIQRGTEKRGRTLADTLGVAERFWDELQSCISSLRDLKKRLDTADPPARDPQLIQTQQTDLEGINTDLHATAPSVDAVKEAGHQLLSLVGEPEKPEIEQRIAELDNSWETITSLYHRRHHDLIEAMERSMDFHSLIDDLLEWLENAEHKVQAFPLVSGLSLNEIQTELESLDTFRREFDRKSVEKEQVRQSAQELVEGTSPDQAKMILKPVQDLSKRWDYISAALNERQQRLERALLQMGQFQQAYDQLMEWMEKSDHTLDEIKASPDDLRQAEIELAKHRVLQNDVQAHEKSVGTINDAGQRLLDSQADENPEATKKKLEDLNSNWEALLKKLADKLAELESSKSQAANFGGKIVGYIQWLDDMDAAFSSTKPTGGLPETAEKQLEDFHRLNDEVELHKTDLEEALFAGEEHLINSPETANSPFAQQINTMKQKWTHLQTKRSDREKKLEIALKDAIHFHDLITKFNDWLNKAEQYLNSLTPVSRILERIAEQMEDHKIFQDEVHAHREISSELNSTGTKLQYYCEKKDAIPIKNLLVSAKHRFDKVVSRSADRTKGLDEGYTEAKEYLDMHSELCGWMDEKKAWLEEEQSLPATSAQKIKEQLDRHKEFQREFGSKQPVYDATSKAGRSLKDKAPRPEQSPIQTMNETLRDKWNGLSNAAIQRQRGLEEALLFSGQFKDAVGSLLEWLSISIPTLSEEQNVHGDLDTVNNLVEQHKRFQSELAGKKESIETVRNASKNLLAAGDTESQQEIQEQMEQLNQKWDTVDQSSESLEKRLQEALRDAQEFHKGAHTLLEWLSDMEIKLKFGGIMPEHPDEIQERLKAIDNLKIEFDERMPEYENTVELGEGILKKSHPRAEEPMKRWIKTLQARWEEVSAYSEQREQRLTGQIQDMKEQDELLDKLLSWLAEKEKTLQEAEESPLAEDMDTVELLIEEHADFETDLRNKQADVDEATKGKKKEEAQVPSETGKDRLANKRASLTGRKPSTKHPKAQRLSERWRQIWLQSMERQRRLQDLLAYLQELKRLEKFDFDDWRQRYLNWMNHNKARVMDFFRRQDKDRDGKVTRDEFIDAVLSSNFRTTRLEMNKVADVFDSNNDGYIDYQEFIRGLKPGLHDKQPETDKEKIKDEVGRQVEMCTCPHKYRINEVGEGKYSFGDNQKLKLVRILRSTVMVRVGGGWEALDEFLVKNDPCRAKGRTNIELRERFILADGVKQGMASFSSNFPAKHSPANGSQASSSSGASSNRPSHHGPVTKIREKTERSMPMRGRGGKSLGSPTSSEASSAISSARRSNSTDFLTPDYVSRIGRGGRRGTGGTPGSKPSSRPPSRGAPESKIPSSAGGGSRPHSRAGSDISDASGHSFDSLGTTPTRIPSLRGRKGVPYSRK